MLVYEAVGEVLREAGVDAVFGLMGDGNLRIVSHLAGPVGIRYFGTRHESAAVSMADGYARVTGNVGVCTVTQGPGVSNTLTAVTAAVKGRTPVLLITGDTPRSIPEHIQGFDQQAMLRVAGAGVQPLRSADTLAQDLRLALHRAARERRPVGIAIPTDLQEETCPAPGDVTPVAPGAWRPPATIPEVLADAADLIEFASRPVIIAGRGAVRAGARDSLVALAEAAGALLATTVPAKALFVGEPYDLGIAGDFSTEVATELIGGADLILAFGASMNYWTTANGELIGRSTHVLQCDAEEAAIGAHTPVTYGIVGDAHEVADALRVELEGRGTAKTGYRSDATRQKIAGFDVPTSFSDRSTGDTVDPRSLVVALDSLLPPERTIAIDGGHFTGFPTMYLRVPDPEAFLFAVNFGAVGLGLGTAMGAAVGRPDRLSVGFLGDGGTLMTLGDLETAVRYELPMMFVVMNDGAYGAELHHLQLLGLPHEESIFGDVDLAAAARALGATAITVRRTDDLQQAKAWIGSPDGPLLLDCKVTRDVRAGWLEQAVRPQVVARAERRRRSGEVE